MEKLEVFYHIACFNNWLGVFKEQMELLRFVNLKWINCCVIGSLLEAQMVQDLASDGHDIFMRILSVNHEGWENPTLFEIWKHAQRSNEAVLYFHSKGVSQPDDKHKPYWRQLMQKHVIAQWRRNLEYLNGVDAVGVNWTDNPMFPHFSGNFWMARCDWLRKLPDPREYITKHKELTVGGWPWERMSGEMWLGSKPGIKIQSLECRNEVHWTGNDLFKHDVSIPGFNYD